MKKDPEPSSTSSPPPSETPLLESLRPAELDRMSANVGWLARMQLLRPVENSQVEVSPTP